MDTRLIFLAAIALLGLTACATQEAKEDAKISAYNTGTSSPLINGPESDDGQNPPMTITKDHKKLSLVKIMDGGICKNEFQGAKGAFLLYADPQDIERIKRERGVAVFKTFETKIQNLSGDVLQAAIDDTNLSEDPFSLGEDEAQQKLAKTLSHNFRNFAAAAIKSFQQETTLTIDIAAYTPSLVFYQKGCTTTLIDPENPDPSS